MAKTPYARTSLTGGGADALDKIDGAVLNDGDIAQVRTSANILYDYSLDADGGGVESSPDRIIPDTNPGTKVWLLQSINCGAGTIVTDHIAESTAAHGVVIDGVTLKDGTVANGANVLTISSTVDTKDIIKGDGTAGRVLRIFDLLIQDGTAANTIKVTMRQAWNGDTAALTDNIGKGATTGIYTLSANGSDLKILDAGITGTVLGVLRGDLSNISNLTTIENCHVSIDGSDIAVSFTTNNGTGVDLTTITTNYIIPSILYITSA